MEEAPAAQHSRIKRENLGVFEVAYEPPTPRSLYSTWSTLAQLALLSPHALRLARDTIRIATGPFLLYLAATLWIALAPSMSIWAAYAGLEIVKSWMIIDNSMDESTVIATLRCAVIVWLVVSASSTLAERLIEEQGHAIDAALKLHFFPILAKASLDLDLSTAIGCTSSIVTGPSELQNTTSKGWDALCGATMHLRTLLSVVVQLLTQAALLYLSRALSIWTIFALGFAVPTMVLLAPSTRFGDAGYVFWTKDVHYTRLSGLHQTIFHPQAYRESLTKSGGLSKVAKEYAEEFANVGAASYSEGRLATSPPAFWRWDVAKLLMDHCPLFYGVCASYLAPVDLAVLTSLALVQFSYINLQRDMTALKFRPITAFLMDAQVLYEGLDSRSLTRMKNGTVRNVQTEKGVKLSFQDVSFGYEDGVKVLDGISFDVSPGQLVVIIGTNGSGKTTLMNLIPRLMDCDSGSILVNGTNLKDFDASALRSAMSILSQKDDFYPLSYRDNLLIGADSHTVLRSRETQIIDDAARMSEASALLEGKHDELYTPMTMEHAYNACFSGAPITPEVVALRDTECPIRQPTQLSGGELQRLLAARMFAKILAAPESCGLLLVDEGLSALDPQTAARVSQRLLDFGKTTIVVTHTFVPLAHRANLILRMEGGKIVQRGTHEELMNSDEVYADMFKAQTVDVVGAED